MRRIEKGLEPDCLAQVRREAVRGGRSITGGDWEEIPGRCKQKMREGLFQEQLGLCAYCCSRLRGTEGARDDNPSAGGMRIEHWVARAADGTHTLDWKNLLGVCQGAGPRGEETCYRVRGQKPLNINPAGRRPVEELFSYSAVGKMMSNDETARRDITTLNLDASHLRDGRREVIRFLQDRLRKDDSSGVIRALNTLMTTPGRDGVLRPFAPVGQWYMKRTARRHKVTLTS